MWQDISMQFVTSMFLHKLKDYTLTFLSIN